MFSVYAFFIIRKATIRFMRKEKRFMQFMEKVLRKIDYIKRGLLS